MKKIFKSAIAVALVAPALLTTSCIEETTPTNVVTATELASSSKATEALLWEMSAIYNKFNTLGNEAPYDWGYGSIMHVRDVVTEDMPITSSDYDWYAAWEQAKNQGEGYIFPQFIWNYMWKVVQTTNNMFNASGYESDDPSMQAAIGIASAFRANAYLDMAQEFEFLPNGKTSGINTYGNDVTGLTVPIVTEATTEEMSKNNPRASRMEMANFILSDLNRAEAFINKSARMSKVMPDLSVVYGLKARLFMWTGYNWNATLSADGTKFEGDGAIVNNAINKPVLAQAAKYARLAIDASGAKPLTEDEWTNTSSGFNTLSTSAWMWGLQLTSEDRVVTTGLLNWTSWMCNETTYGYAASGPYVLVYKPFYDKINDKDFRKLSWKAPTSSDLYDKLQFVSEKTEKKVPTYGSLKFRPGSGNPSEYLISSSTAIPLMRVEEMYLIEAEATAQNNEAQGKQLLENFMQTYRYASYSVPPTADIVEEIIFQKRVELWGEGLTFFDVKRLNMSVDRKKSGTNFYSAAQLVSEGRPAWMNFVIVMTEQNSNAGVRGWNNPSFDGLYN